MRAVFMGTPDFAVPSLQALMEHHEVVGVVTQPDRPAGRGQSVRQSPVKRLAVSHNIPVLQPQRVADPAVVEELKALAPEVIVVVAFGQKIPPSILSLPPYGCINVHGSLLPKYRGASPIHWAIIDGNKETGVTTMLMDEGWDTGDILLQETVEITGEDTAGTLHDKLAVLGADLLIRTLAGLADGTVTARPQDHDEANYVSMLRKEDGLIDWNQPANRIRDFVRGMQPWPGAFSYLGDTMVKILQVEVADDGDELGEVEKGTIVKVDNGGVEVAAAPGSVRLVTVQPENRSKMSGVDFANGYRLEPGQRFRAERLP
ncbi:MAG: methionyl-tRNA formyltransferase [Firmicutes bacterium]|nr:methionyl-tRNA formyltransferase [Bacillota bacterium]